MEGILQTASKYSLMAIVSDAIETGNVMPMTSWKKSVLRQLRDYENKVWGVSSPLYPSIQLMCDYLTEHTLLSWWQYAHIEPSQVRKCMIIVKLLFGQSKLNSCLFRYKDNSVASPLCNLCDMYKEETIDHLLFRCKKYEALRCKLFSEVMYCCPSTSLCTYLESKSHKVISRFILTGLHNTFTFEWLDFFSAICNFIYGMHSAREKEK